MKTLNMFAVIWTDQGRIEYGVPLKDLIVVIEPKEDIKVNLSKNKIGRPKYRYADTQAIFKEKKEAEAFREGNKDWKVVTIKIEFNY